MKILLVGEYSGLHYNLAQGLKALGHQVTIASDGDGWKDYPRDIDFLWKEKKRRVDIISKLVKSLPKMLAYDVVQLINPVFLDLKAENNLRLFRYLKKHNKAVFLGANGDDYVYVDHGVHHHFSSSVFNVERIRNLASIQAHINTKLSDEYRQLNLEIAEKCSGITACCTEYRLAYASAYDDKTTFIPLPVILEDYPFINTIQATDKVKFFLGIQEKRKVIKGMDIIHEALQELKNRYPNDVDLQIARSVPFKQYQTMMDTSHILCDQLYSYGCGVNGAMAMAKGLIVAGGGEEQMYQLFGETENKPLVNLPDAKQEVVKVLEELLEKRENLPLLAQKTREFAIKHHDHIKVAQQYVDFWASRMS